MSVGRSSGGSVAALATGMVWLDTGNDLGWSQQIPAVFPLIRRDKYDGFICSTDGLLILARASVARPGMVPDGNMSAATNGDQAGGGESKECNFRI